jgi:hypothetical protein
MHEGVASEVLDFCEKPHLHVDGNDFGIIDIENLQHLPLFAVDTTHT